MEHTPLVTVLTPTYNHERYLADCIESVLGQTFGNWEMIVLNDGSTDRTAEIAGKYCREDSRIKLVNQENIGIFRLSETYNRGLGMASGTYIAILEGDDWWSPDKLEKQVSALQNDREAVLCWSMARCVNSDRSQVYYSAPDLDTPDAGLFNNDPAGSILNIFLFRNCIPALTILIRKNFLFEIGGFKQVHHLPLVDLPTLYELALKGRFIFLPEILGEWRMYATQVTKTFPVEMTEGFFRLANDYIGQSAGLSGLRADKRALRKYYERRLVISYARSGRYKLIRREFGSARKDYRRAIAGYGFIEITWKLRAIVGWIFSFFHMDVEGLAKRLGRRSYS